MKPAIRNRLIKLHGSSKLLPGGKMLRAGGLKLLYENGSIRYISAGDTELIRMTYSAVRDENWLTIEPEISDEIIKSGKDWFRITYHATYRQKDIDFEAEYKFTGSDDEITCEFKGCANSTFMKNRIGFCVLHPVDSCKGKVCSIGHPDGSNTSSVFPVNIAPHQPFKNISRMNWSAGKDLSMEINFYGDLFETEDQRNWTDASYKTYSTPLSLAHPVQITKGTIISQKIRFKVNGKTQKVQSIKRAICISAGDVFTDIPEIGLCISSRKAPLTVNEAACFKDTGLTHLRGELHLFSEKLNEQYTRITEESEKTSLPVQLCLFFDERIDVQIHAFVQLYKSHPISIHSIILFDAKQKVTPSELIEVTSPVLRNEIGTIRTGAGTNCNFAQLNRVHVNSELVDFISYAIHPQEHASDDLTLIENLAAQQDTIETARGFSDEKLICISPVTLQRRFNANVSTYEIEGDRRKKPMQVDVRQMSLFCAAWTVGSIKYLAGSGASCITYFETVGERGLIMGDHESEWPDEFPAFKGMYFPVFHILRFLLKSRNYRLSIVSSDHPGIIDGFSLHGKEKGYVILSNFTAEPQHIVLGGFSGLTATLRINTLTFNRLANQQNYESHVEENMNSGIFKMLPYETMILSFFVSV
jgi:hypothetical protein